MPGLTLFAATSVQTYTFASALLSMSWQVAGFPRIDMGRALSEPMVSAGWVPVDLGAALQKAARPQPALSVDSEAEQPGRLFLDQNFPNPFNPSTMIRYGLPGGSRVKLTVHTLIGTRIRVLVDQWQDPGVYTYDMFANDLPSGAYFYRLQTEFGTITRRMIVSK
jgi:hypothetical protein